MYRWSTLQPSSLDIRPKILFYDTAVEDQWKLQHESIWSVLESNSEYLGEQSRYSKASSRLSQGCQKIPVAINSLVTSDSLLHFDCLQIWSTTNVKANCISSSKYSVHFITELHPDTTGMFILRWSWIHKTHTWVWTHTHPSLEKLSLLSHRYLCKCPHPQTPIFSRRELKKLTLNSWSLSM